MKVVELNNLRKDLLELFKNIYEYRLLIVLLLDIFSIIISLFLTNILTNNIYEKLNISILFFSLYIISFSFAINTLNGLYKSIIRFVGSRVAFKIVFNNLIISFLSFVSAKILNLNHPPINFFIVNFFIVNSLFCFTRFGSRDFFIYLQENIQKSKKKIAIYGAGSAGYQLAKAIQSSKKYKIFIFIDDNKKLIGRQILGVPIYSINDFYKIKDKIDEIFLAIPSATPKQVNHILERIKSYSIPIFRIPSIDELNKNKNIINSLVPISSEELLSRKPIKADKDLLIKGIKNYSVCITGAGGSIGSELAKQISELNPRNLILIDNSEHNLYQLEKTLGKSKIDRKFILGDVTSKKFLDNVFKKYKIDIIFHTAAYKHVPIVENNILQGIKNNVFSTYIICQLARKRNLKKVIYISSDKAVRPTNVMGATKRLGELIIQAYSEIENSFNDKNKKIIFSMVRFGNVVGSSGSVVPLFKNQIKTGGPITVTDKRIVRYFMSINEAAELVIQAAELSLGGEVFLIEMGQPVNIYDLAKQMILHSGLKVKDSENSEGDIEIKITGLRPGEKLYEELLIDDNSLPTTHPKIYKAYEKKIPKEELFVNLEKLERYISENNSQKSIEILSYLVEEWKWNKNLIDN